MTSKVNVEGPFGKDALRTTLPLFQFGTQALKLEAFREQEVLHNYGLHVNPSLA